MKIIMFLFLALTIISPPIIFAEECKSYECFQQKIELLNPKPKLAVETYLVDLKIGRVNYKIPRNYILSSDENALKINFIYKKNDQNSNSVQECNGSKYDNLSVCSVLEVRIRSGHSNVNAFKDISETFSKAANKEVPHYDKFEYKIYTLKQGNLITHFYTKQDKNIFFYCDEILQEHSKNYSCFNSYDLTDGNSASFYFNSLNIENIESLNTNID